VEVSLSAGATWVQQVKSAAATQTEGVRPEEVIRAKEEIANGTLESNIDMDAMLDALLMEL